MCIQGYNDLVPQCALVFEIQPCQGEAEGLRLLRRRLYQFQGQLS